MLDVIARHLDRGVGVGVQRGEEVGVGFVHDGQFGRTPGTFDRVAAEGVGLDGRGLSGLQQQGGDAGVPVEQVDDLRLPLLDVEGVAEGAVLAGLEGVDAAVNVDIQLLDDDVLVGAVGQGAPDAGFLAAAGESQRGECEGAELIAIFFDLW